MLIIIVQKLNYSEAQNARRRECATFDGGINMCSYESHNDMIRKLQNIGKFLFNSEIRGLCSKNLWITSLLSNVWKKTLFL